MKLIIVESPTKAKKIEGFLGKEYIVRASVGHVRDLPKSNKKAVDIEHGFTPHYEVDPKKLPILKELRDYARKASHIYLATDPDREGEAIAWHIKDELKLDTAERVTYNEITESAVRYALDHPREIDMHLKDAQEARRVLDRLVGYDLSQIVWKKVRYGLSAGRVQSPALRIIMEREREIRSFIPVQYFQIAGEFETVGRAKESKKYKIVLDCAIEPNTKEEADVIISKAKKQSWSVIEIEESEVNRSPRAPFTTSTLQQTASSRLGYAPKRTMGIAQKLYEKGLITYMRTDSTSLAASAVSDISSYIVKNHGQNYLQTREYKTKSKNAQEAHEAIRPTHFKDSNSGNATDDEKRLYSLIWDRTVASQMSNAKMTKTKIIANITDKSIPNFSTVGSIVIFDGFLAVDTESRSDDVILPKINKDDDLDLLAINAIEKWTQPPSRYSEAGLIKELEKRGIGRPSTFASICSTIEDRGYVLKENKALSPTDTGEVVSNFLEEHFGEYIGDDFTAKMEDQLDAISNGETTYVEVLTEFYNKFHSAIIAKNDIDKVTNLGAAPEGMLCPLCNSHMVEKLARNGKFYSCSRYPECMGARKIDGNVMEGPKEIGKPCPKCKDGQLVEREGKYGKFISCSNYPKCKHIEQSESERAAKSTGVKCNVCNDGMMEERRGRFGVFYSCANYPKCKNAIKAKPTGNLCKLCQSLMMEGTKTIPERCSSKICPMHNPHKMVK